MKFSRGDQVIHDVQRTVGIVLGSFLDWDNRWYVAWRSSRDVLFVSSEASLNWYPTPAVKLTLDPLPGITLAGHLE